MARRGRGVAVVAVVGLAIAGSAVLRGGTSGGAPAAPRFVEEAAAAGIDHTFGGEDRWFVGGGWRCSIATTTTAPTCTSPAAPARRCSRNASPVGGASASRPSTIRRRTCPT